MHIDPLGAGILRVFQWLKKNQFPLITWAKALLALVKYWVPEAFRITIRIFSDIANWILQHPTLGRRLRKIRDTVAPIYDAMAKAFGVASQFERRYSPVRHFPNPETRASLLATAWDTFIQTFQNNAAHIAFIGLTWQLASSAGFERMRDVYIIYFAVALVNALGFVPELSPRHCHVDEVIRPEESARPCDPVLFRGPFSPEESTHERASE